ncbi:MAG: HEAT repeat domain-containing protein [Verrucomicrobiae bacterium]|nr:HEAT repeat domain-containing protein [Verrucomicrobiae bacterium]
MKLILLLIVGAATSFAGEAELLAVLKSDAKLEDKVAACRQLAVCGTRNAVPVLAPLLADEKLAHMARYALEPIPDPAVDEALREALGKLKGKLLIGVINSIAVRRDKQAIPHLLRLWTEPDSDVADAAAAALGKLGSVEAAPKLTGDAALRCAEALIAEGNRKEGLAIYERLLQDKTPPVRAAAVRGLLCFGNAPLEKFLVEDDPVAFAAALKAVQDELPGEAVTRAVAAQLEKLTPVSKPLLIAALGNRGDVAALPAVLAAAKAGDRATRVAAFRALAQFGRAEAVPVLAAAVTDPDLGAAAQEALVGLPGKEADAAILALFDKPESCPVAIALATQRRLSAAMPALMKLSKDPTLRSAALKAVGELAGEPDLPALLDLLVAGGGDAAEQALIAACGRLPGALEPVLARLEGAPASAKGTLFRVLAAIGGAKALAAVRAGVTDNEPEVRRAAVRALATWKNTEAATDLLEFAKSLPDATDRLLCLRGAITLAANESSPAEERLKVCRAAEALIARDEERRLLLGTLGRLAHPESLAMVLAYLDNPATKAEAALAAVNLGERLRRTHRKEVAQALQKVLQATDDPALKERINALLGAPAAKKK